MKAAYRAKGRTDKELRRKEKGNGADSRGLRRAASDGEVRLKAGDNRLGARGRYRVKWKTNALNTKNYGNGFSVARTCSKLWHE